MATQDIIKLKTTPLSTINKGKVTLVGAGPGDPELLTVKAVNAINTADIILYDQLVSEEIRQLFPSTTTAIFVGKSKGRHSIAQESLNQLLINKAQQGLNVCRLKGGDPFIFGRGGEEMLHLKSAGIDTQLIPGITAGIGCTSYAGIPVTHRGLSQGCTFITAHAETELKVNWKALATLDHTLVVYMGISKALTVQKELLGGGLNPKTPVAVIENGCREDQRVICGHLPQLQQLIVQHSIKSPALVVIGKVVSLAESLQWFQRQLTENQKLSA